MSSVGQAIGGIVGGVVGFFTPVGPLYGAQIGMMVGGVLDPPKTQGPRLEDLTAQTSVYGAFVPRLYGTTAVTGNVIWIQGDKLIEHSVESEGKGGPAVTTFEYFATFAVGLCEGPLDGVRRIWIGGQLWYDAGSEDLSTIIASNEAATTFTLYSGTDTQLADPLIQADRGASNVPAYRGLAYIVFDELPLKDYGNSLMGAQVKVEVAKIGASTPRLIDDYSIVGSNVMINGDPYDSDGFTNYIKDSGDGYPLWMRRIADNEALSRLPGTQGNIDSLLDTAGDPLFPAAYTIDDGTQVSLDTQQYAFLVLPNYVCWGRNGRVTAHPALEGAGGQFGVEIYGFAESAGVIWFICDGAFTARKLVRVVDDWTEGELNTAGASLTISGTTLPVLIVDDGDAYTASREPLTGAITINRYTFSGGAVSLLDSFTLTPPDANSITSTYSAAYAKNGMMYVITRPDGPNTTDAKLLTIDLAAQSLLSTIVLEHTYAGSIATGMSALRVDGNVVHHAHRIAATTNRHRVWSTSVFTAAGTVLSGIVEAECLQSDLLTAGDLDVTELTDPVRGYRVSSRVPLRGGIDQLRKAWPFDAVQRGYGIKFKKRGGASVATITEGELDAREAGAAPGVRLSNTREMDLIMPQQLTVQYMDATREYDVNVAEESR